MPSDLARVLDRYVDFGDALRPELLEEPNRLALATALKSGRLCVIRDAFRTEFAEYVANFLGSLSGWENVAIAQHPFTAFFGAALEQEQFPDELHRLRAVFDHPNTKRMVGEWSGLDCDGSVRMHASRFVAGHYNLPHNDRGLGEVSGQNNQLQVAFDDFLVVEAVPV